MKKGLFALLMMSTVTCTALAFPPYENNLMTSKIKRIALIASVKPEKEMEYRLLHQSVWLGVVDQMARGNNRNFSIFLVEIDKTIYEFFYLEYVGTDPKKDAEMNSADPTNIRWWKLTDACQTPLPGTKDIWSMMDKMSDKETK